MLTPPFHIRLVPEWRHCWRMASVLASLVLALLSAVQLEVLPLVAPLVSPEHWPWVSAGFALAIIVLRLIDQGLRTRADPGQSPGGDGPHKPSETHEVLP